MGRRTFLPLCQVVARTGCLVWTQPQPFQIILVPLSTESPILCVCMRFSPLVRHAACQLSSMALTKLPGSLMAYKKQAQVSALVTQNQIAELN